MFQKKALFLLTAGLTAMSASASDIECRSLSIGKTVDTLEFSCVNTSNEMVTQLKHIKATYVSGSSTLSITSPDKKVKVNPGKRFKLRFKIGQPQRIDDALLTINQPPLQTNQAKQSTPTTKAFSPIEWAKKNPAYVGLGGGFLLLLMYLFMRSRGSHPVQVKTDQETSEQKIKRERLNQALSRLRLLADEAKGIKEKTIDAFDKKLAAAMGSSGNIISDSNCKYFTDSDDRQLVIEYFKNILIILKNYRERVEQKKIQVEGHKLIIYHNIDIHEEKVKSIPEFIESIANYEIISYYPERFETDGIQTWILCQYLNLENLNPFIKQQKTFEICLLNLYRIQYAANILNISVTQALTEFKECIEPLLKSVAQINKLTRENIVDFDRQLWYQLSLKTGPISTRSPYQDQSLNGWIYRAYFDLIPEILQTYKHQCKSLVKDQTLMVLNNIDTLDTFFTCKEPMSYRLCDMSDVDIKPTYYDENSEVTSHLEGALTDLFFSVFKSEGILIKNKEAIEKYINQYIDFISATNTVYTITDLKIAKGYLKYAIHILYAISARLDETSDKTIRSLIETASINLSYLESIVCNYSEFKQYELTSVLCEDLLLDKIFDSAENFIAHAHPISKMMDLKFADDSDDEAFRLGTVLAYLQRLIDFKTNLNLPHEEESNLYQNLQPKFEALNYYRSMINTNDYDSIEAIKEDSRKISSNVEARRVINRLLNFIETLEEDNFGDDYAKNIAYYIELKGLCNKIKRSAVFYESSWNNSPIFENIIEEIDTRIRKNELYSNEAQRDLIVQSEIQRNKEIAASEAQKNRAIAAEHEAAEQAHWASVRASNASIQHMERQNRLQEKQVEAAEKAAKNQEKLANATNRLADIERNKALFNLLSEKKKI
ncbi:MAG: hypothetical protein KHX35_11285 [Sutterella wadsworthensis]|nr:hypothetical protein [Sutterella wadsworthensis]